MICAAVMYPYSSRIMVSLVSMVQRENSTLLPGQTQLNNVTEWDSRRCAVMSNQQVQSCRLAITHNKG